MQVYPFIAVKILKDTSVEDFKSFITTLENSTIDFNGHADIQSKLADSFLDNKDEFAKLVKALSAAVADNLVSGLSLKAKMSVE